MEQLCGNGGCVTPDPNVKRISYFQFIWTIFLLTSAGPFGFEYTVIGVGVGYTLLLITLFALFYAFPIALVSSELACMMPSRHGQIIWAYRAFNKINPKLGDFVGFLNAANVVIFWCLNTTVIPIVLVQYISTMLNGPLSNIATYFVKLAFILSGLILNVFNFSIITRITSILCVGIILPFFVAFFWTLPNIDPTTQWIDCNTNWPLAITTCLWEFAGFESLGSIVNEINFHPRRLYSGYIIGIIADISMLYLPILSVATLTNNECTAWFDGFFAVGYAKLATTLQYSVAIGSILINWCIYVSAVGIVSRMVWATAQPYFELHSDGRLVIQEEGYDSAEEEYNNNNNNNDNRYNTIRIAINILPNKYIGQIFEPTGSPIYAVILVSLFMALTNVYLGFDSLVEFNLFTYFVFFVIECASYLILKHMEPETERLFEIPFGKIGGWICVIILVFGLGICFFIMVIDDASLFAVALAMNILLILYYFGSKYFCHRMHQNDILTISKDKYQQYSDDIHYDNDDNDDDGYQEIQPLI